MSVTISTNDNKAVVIDRTLLSRFSPLAKDMLAGDAAEIALNIPHRHLELIHRYMEHHSTKESVSPVPPIQKDWKLDSVFIDTWDGEFFKTVQTEEKDPDMVDFCKSVEYLSMDNLLRKTTLVITMNIIEKTGLDSDKIAEEFTKRILTHKNKLPQN